ncbi:hypothetical protein [Acinetobacter baumannii]|uniref:hypothetical protein n=1 Tax=Acinetobacter baumannii TaxID=470 RepID=UPI001436BC0B|nr:hypothetical protein [Acinetobacter baumannii]
MQMLFNCSTKPLQVWRMMVLVSFPEEGTWLLNKGERVLNPQDKSAPPITTSRGRS